MVGQSIGWSVGPICRNSKFSDYTAGKNYEEGVRKKKELKKVLEFEGTDRDRDRDRDMSDCRGRGRNSHGNDNLEHTKIRKSILILDVQSQYHYSRQIMTINSVLFRILSGALTDGSTVEERMYVKDFKVNAADVRNSLI